jgi:hypothetical protein
MSQASAGQGRVFGLGRFGVVCALVAAAALSLPVTSSAVAGTISGTVTKAADGSPLQGIEVCAYGFSGGFGGCDESDAGGEYAISGLAAGSYRVAFESSGSKFARQYYDGIDSWFDATPVSVGTTGTTPGIDAAMKETGSIGGTVTDAADDEPIAGVSVCAEIERGPSSFTYCDETGGDGTYAVDGLAPGDYEVSFRGTLTETSPGEFTPVNYITQYYEGKLHESEADPVTVTEGASLAGIDAAMEEGAEIAGTVVAAADGKPRENVQACLYVAATGAQGRCAYTDADGHYLLFGLPGGNYKVGFGIESFGSPYTPQYYDDKPTLATADVVALTTGARTSGIDAEMHEAGKVAGTVTAAKGGAGIEGLQVCAQPVQSGSSRCASTGVGGGYTIDGVRPGKYVVEFRGPPDYLQQYYSGKANYSEAARITVAEETTTSGIDASMQAAGRIKGKVTAAATGGSVSGVEVCATQSTSVFIYGGACAQSAPDGTYTVGGLAGGSYDVRFAPGYTEAGPGENAKQNFLTQFYKGAPSRATAAPVAVTLGQATTGIDAAMQAGGKVSGHVTAADTGKGLAAYVCVLATVRGGDEGCTFADGNGDYTLQGLRSGSYKVRFGAGPSNLGYVRQFYAGKATRKEANPVVVAAGATTSGIDATLQRGGTVSGTVTDADTDEPLAGIDVCVGFFAACDTTAADGTYELTLPTGAYRVRFGGPSFGPGSGNPVYAPVYYHDAYSYEAASKVAVTAGGASAGIDQAMHEGARVAGTVVDAVSKDPLGEITVCASDPAAGACDQTDETGAYAITGLPAGSYRVRFSHDSAWPPSVNAGYAPLYYDDSLTAAGATLIDLGFGELAGGVDAEMRQGGSVEGTITRASDNAPVPGTQACATLDTGGEEGRESCAVSEEDGSYAIEGLTSGDYVIAFYPGLPPTQPSDLLHQYYDGALKWSDATPVSVTIGAATEGIDAALGAGGKITGRITGAADGVPLEGVNVCAYEAAGDEEEPAACESSNGHGEYTLANLAPGAYRLKFSALFYEGEEDPFAEEEGEAVPPREEFLTQFYSGKSSLATATEVGVGAGATTAGIDVQMVRPGAAVGEDPPAGGGATAPPPARQAVTPTPKPKPPKCRKGFRKKRVHGKQRCVKQHRRKHRHAQR